MNLKHALALSVSLLGLAGTLPSAWAGLNLPVVRQDDSIDPFLSTTGTVFAAANLGSAAPVTRNGATFPAAGTSANPTGTNWSVIASNVDQSLGTYGTIDPLFFSESWGGDPVTLAVTNLNPSKTYLVQILHGEPRSSYSGTFSNNDFLLSNGVDLDVPDFTIGNGVAAENPPAALDRAIVEVELGGISSFTYRMKGGTGRGPSIAGFQVRELPGFANVTASVAPGLPGLNNSSVAWGDYDNDGRLDFLLTGNNGSGEISQLWRNTGSGFTNVTANVAPGLLGVQFSSAAWGDYDNDGRLDFLITGVNPSSGRFSQLWRNTGSGFTNVTASVAPGLPGVSASSVAWGDYDNDGRLDFLLTGRIANNPISQLWRNTGSGFTNMTASVAPGLLGINVTSVAWGDYDNDGRLDFLLTGLNGTSRISQIWRNTGSGFTNVTVSVAPGLPGLNNSSLAWGDYDNDGRLDFLLMGDNSGGQVSQLWRNNSPVSNTPPSAPTGLNVSATGSGLAFTWNAASDSQTPQNGLAHHLRIGTTPGGSDLLAPMAAADGQPLLPRSGALRPSLSRTLNGLPIGQPIYWSVQAADSGFAASPFATEQVLTLAGVPVPANGTYTPGDTNGDGVVSEQEFAAVRSALGTNELATQNAAGYYTQAQVQSLNVGTPLISQVSPGRFRLTLGVQKSTNLTNPFTDFSLTAPGTTTEFTPDGKLKFEFPATDNAAFFRIEAE